MEGYLKKVEVREDTEGLTCHPIKLYFSKDDFPLDFDEIVSDNDLYRLSTTIETLLCSVEERNKGLTDSELNAKIDYIKSYIGRCFNINLFYITVRDLTDGKYVAFEREFDDYIDSDSEEIYEYKMATYRTNEDTIKLLKYNITLSGLLGDTLGITYSGRREKITTELFFSDFKPELPAKAIDKYASLTIPYAKYQHVTINYIINQAPLSGITSGLSLANRIKNKNISRKIIDNCIKTIENYRYQKLLESTLKYKLQKTLHFFWKKDTIKEPVFADDINAVLIASYIVSKEYLEECADIAREAVEEILYPQKNHDNEEEAIFSQFSAMHKNFLRLLKAKYKDKNFFHLVI